MNWIEIRGARQHNLKNLSVKLPKYALTVVTGPSGSGKSSLAFDTLFAEGQRRYMESLSTYVRQFLDKQEKPDVDEIKGLSPTIAIEQKNQTKNSRSTVGTSTELYDYLRLLYSKLGVMYCLRTGEAVKRDRVSEIVARYFKDAKLAGRRLYLVFPVELAAKSKIQDRKLLLKNLLERGYSKALLDEGLKTGRAIAPLDIQEELALKKGAQLTGRAGASQSLLVVADRMAINDESQSRFADAMAHAYQEGFGRARVLLLNEEGDKLAQEARFADYPSSGGGEHRYPELTPLLFSFNSPMGACEACKGFGNQLKIDPRLVIPNPGLSLAQGAIEPFTKPASKHWLKETLLFCQSQKIPLSVPWQSLAEKDREKIWSGFGQFPGVEGLFEQLESDRYKMQVRVFLSRYRSPRTCPTCKGARLRAEARSVLLHGKGLGDLTALSIEELAKWFKETPFSKLEKSIAKEIFQQIEARVDFLLRVGLDYLRLDRLTKTLSGGEAQRIALANQLGARLTQTTYVLDEPSIGLHPRDTERLIEIMRDLVKLKNTVVVVEHDPDIIRSAEYLLDVGPEAGERGGEIVYSGPYGEFEKSAPKNSLTAAYMAGSEGVAVPKRRRLARFEDRKQKVQWLELTGCKENNLRDVKLRVPLRMFSCVTGVSGSGKSSAIRKTLYPALAKIFLQENLEVGVFERISGFEGVRSVQLIDQQPIGRSPRSNPITFMKGFDEVRALFASTIEARKKNMHAGHFSFNVPGGRCETCEGDGYMRVEMVFMEDMFLLCDVCEGKRFKKEVLDIRYQDKNIADVLNMTVSEARRFFHSEKRLHKVLDTLDRVGLGYLRLGQASNTLSGGESQRLKIARELAMAESNSVIYVLDEPTTGLHFRDVKVLIGVLNELVERGNTVIVIEHNVDVMKSADWIIDFGPEGGVRGGKVVSAGTPEDVAAAKAGFTPRYLREALKNSRHVPIAELLGSFAPATQGHP